MNDATAITLPEGGDDAEAEATVLRPILEVLRELRASGQPLLDRLAVEQLAMIRAVLDRGKAGTLTLTLTYRPHRDSGIVVDVIPEVKAKPPEPAREAALFYVDDHLQLRTEHPRQRSMFEERDRPRVARD